MPKKAMGKTDAPETNEKAEKARALEMTLNALEK